MAFISISLLCVMAGLSSGFPSPEQKLPIIVIPAREDTGGPMNMLAINILCEAAHAASTPVLIFGTGVFDYNIPYVPDGTYQIEAIITTTGYPVTVLPVEILAEGKSSSTVIITGKEFIGGIDILLEDSTSEVINLAAQASAQNRNSGMD